MRALRRTALAVGVALLSTPLLAQEAPRARTLYDARQALATESAEEGKLDKSLVPVTFLERLTSEDAAVAMPMPSVLPGNIRVRGWLDQGFTWNPDDPDNRLNGPQGFNYRSNEYLMNQLYLIIERPVNVEGGTWDIGGRVDLLYGTDYQFTEALGLELEQDGTEKWNSDSHRTYGFALPQFYVEAFAPIGGGLTIKAGHFYTIIGYETVTAPDNFFYSHLYTHIYGEPFTHTGMLASYNLTPDIVVHSGWTLGADNFTDPNDNLGYLGGITWQVCPGTSIAYAFHWSEDSFDPELENSAEYIHSIVFQHEICPGLRYVFESDFGYGEDQKITRSGGLAHAEWYGTVHYLFYDITPTLTFGTRFEWFRDEDNARILGLGEFADGGNYFDLTFGLNWRPLPCLIVRPEARWDWSNVDSAAAGIDGVFDDFSDKNQFTGAVDVILTF